MLAERQRKRFTTAEYHQMTAAGILSENDRVELVEGEILRMAAMGSVHAACLGRLTRLFSNVFMDRVIVWVQNPIRIGEYSEPEPDVALLKNRADFYAEGHPTPEDVYLIVEAADSSIGYDRGFKLPVYARSGVREVWVVDLDAACVEAYSQPSKNGYKLIRRGYKGDSLALASFPDELFYVDDILGRDDL